MAYTIYKPDTRLQWFLEIAFVSDVNMCVCVSAPKAINN